MGRKVCRYGEKGVQIWGKGVQIWGEGVQIWGMTNALIKTLILKVFQNKFSIFGVQIWGGKGVQIWGVKHIPSDLVVTPRASHNTLDLSIRYPHDVSSAPMAICMEMRHGTDRQTDTPQPHHHRRFPR